MSGGAEQRFRIYVPPDYDPSRSWPAVLSLHGAGERGSDGLAQTEVGLGHTLRNRATPFAAFVVFPQCPRDSHWAAPATLSMAMEALDATIAEFNIDSARIALTGISMGGAGAWLLGARHPERFSSLAPICGWVSARSDEDRWSLLGRLREIPIWIFHGSADTIVPVDASRSMAAALRNAGADVRYTELAGVGHNSWDEAYGNSELLEWMIDPLTVNG